jgi:hypothetical protein
MIALAETEYVLNPMQCAHLQYGSCASNACNYDRCVTMIFTTWDWTYYFGQINDECVSARSLPGYAWEGYPSISYSLEWSGTELPLYSPSAC